MKQIKAWSYTRYADYKTCPRKAKFKHVDKVAEPPNEAMERGARVHNELAAYIFGTRRSGPDGIKLPPRAKVLRKLREKNPLLVTVEEPWALTKNWGRTRWNDWKGCWLRVRTDATETRKGGIIVVDDWKTGKMRPEQKDSYLIQLSLYALAAFAWSSTVKVVLPFLHFVDAEATFPGPGDVELRYDRISYPELRGYWEGQVKAMLHDTLFAPLPGFSCRWCWYGEAAKREKGGPGLCEF